METRDNHHLIGGALHPSASIAAQMERTMTTLIKAMARETERELRQMLDSPEYAMDTDGNPASRARIILSGIRRKYEPLFAKWAAKAAKRMVNASLRQSTTTLRMSLHEIAEDLTLSPDLFNSRLREVVTASTNEAAMLIRTIPTDYLTKVQGAVMRSITSGSGLSTLVPFLRKQYGENIRKARNVAHDQTRKAYGNINATRLQAMGSESFEWRHSHGGKHPRPQHEAWNGKIFRWDDLPVDDRFGPVIPGQAINCRCFARPVFTVNK